MKHRPAQLPDQLTSGKAFPAEAVVQHLLALQRSRQVALWMGCGYMWSLTLAGWGLWQWAPQTSISLLVLIVMLFIVPYGLTTTFAFCYPHDHRNAIFITGISGVLAFLAHYLIFGIIPHVVPSGSGGISIGNPTPFSVEFLFLALIILAWAILCGVLGRGTATLFWYLQKKVICHEP